MQKQLLVITGMSGAGKTTASNNLEDMGFICIDRYPTELLDDLVELILRDTSYKYQKVALTLPIIEFEKYRFLLELKDLSTIFILMVCSEEEIINRYKFTRRIHPLLISNMADTLQEAVHIEKKLADEYSLLTHNIIDTTDLSIKNQKRMLDDILQYDHKDNFAVSFVSFGYKNGIPEDADFIIDVRMLDNPFYLTELRSKTGNDREVYEYVLNNKNTHKYLSLLTAYLDFCFETYVSEEKRHLTVCVGCTGGQHRSVSIVNYLYDYYHGSFLTFKKHRELKDE